jgi:hypothetical protein
VKEEKEEDQEREDDEVLILALDLFVRVGIGQFERVLETFEEQYQSHDLDDVNVSKEYFYAAKEALNIPRNGSHSINNANKVPNIFRRAYELQKEIKDRRRSQEVIKAVRKSEP